MRKNRWIVALLAVMLVLTLLPASALAQEAVTVTNGMNFDAQTTQDEIDSWAGEGAATIQANADGTYTVTLLKSITLQTGATTPVTFGNYDDGAEQTQMILDLNGCTLSAKTIVLSNYGNLTIMDGKGGGSVVYDGGQYLSAVQNAGYTLTINGGAYICKGASTATNGGAISGAAGTLTVINAGTFHSDGSGALTTFGKMVIHAGTATGAYGVVAKQPSSGTASDIEIPADSSFTVDADSFALVVVTDGSAGKPEGTIRVAGGQYDAPNVAGKTGEADVTQSVSITGGSYTANPAGFVGENQPVVQITANGAAGAYLVGDTAAAQAANAAAGDTVSILQGDLVLENMPEGVIVVNGGSGDVRVNGVQVPAGETVTVTAPQEPEVKPDVPKTGDHGILLWVAVLVTLAGVCASLVLRRRQAAVRR